MLRTGSIINSILWGIRMMIRTSFQVFIVDSLFGMSQIMIRTPFDALSYDKANKDNVIRHTIFREMTINGSRAIFFLVMALISNILIAFIFGGTHSLLFLIF